MPAWHEAKWEAPGEQTKRRRFGWGWLWLLLIPAAMIAFSVARYNGYWQFTDMTFTTLVCEESVEPSAIWADMQTAKCTEDAIPGIDIELLNGADPAGAREATTPTTWTFRAVQSAFSTTSINITFQEPTGRTFLVNADTEPPAVIFELNGDVAGLHYSELFDQDDAENFYIVTAP